MLPTSLEGSKGGTGGEDPLYRLELLLSLSLLRFKRIIEELGSNTRDMNLLWLNSHLFGIHGVVLTLKVVFAFHVLVHGDVGGKEVSGIRLLDS